MPDEPPPSLAVHWVSPIERQVERFLETELARVGPRVIARVEVRLMRAGTEIARLDRVDDPALFEAGPLHLAHAVVSACTNNMSGSAFETFSIVAIGAAGARSSLRIRVDGDEPPSAGGEPTTSGLLEQLVRHNEVLLHAALRGSSATNDVLATMNEKLMSRVTDLEDKRQRYVDERDELEAQRHGRALEAQRDQRRSEMAQQFMTTMLPLVASHVSRGASPGATSGRSQRERLLDALLVSLSEDDGRLAQLATLLRPQELAIMAELGRGMEHAATPSGSAPETPSDRKQ